MAFGTSACCFLFSSTSFGVASAVDVARTASPGTLESLSLELAPVALAFPDTAEPSSVVASRAADVTVVVALSLSSDFFLSAVVPGVVAFFFSSGGTAVYQKIYPGTSKTMFFPGSQHKGDNRMLYRRPSGHTHPVSNDLFAFDILPFSFIFGSKNFASWIDARRIDSTTSVNTLSCNELVQWIPRHACIFQTTRTE